MLEEEGRRTWGDEQTSVPTLGSYFLDVVPVKLRKRMSEMTTWDCASSSARHNDNHHSRHPNSYRAWFVEWAGGYPTGNT